MAFGYTLGHGVLFPRCHKSITIKRAVVLVGGPKSPETRPARRGTAQEESSRVITVFIALSCDYLATKGRMYLDRSAGQAISISGKRSTGENSSHAKFV